MISPIEMNGVINRTQDIANLRHNEEQKSIIDQGNVNVVMENKRDEDAYTVQITGDSDKTDTKHDAKEESKNKYFDNRKKDKKSEKKDEDVIVKKKQSYNFDIKI